MTAITVLGEVDENTLGIISPHEHILVDSRKRLSIDAISEVSKKNLFCQKVKMSNLGELRMDFLSVLDNLILSDTNLAIEELMEFKKFGGDTIIDQTNEGMGRDPVALKNISRITGLNIVTCTGHYTDCMQQDYVKKEDESCLANIMIKEIEEGIGNTGVRAGVIGEIGLSREFFPNEKKVLRASAIAHKETGASIFVHTSPWGIMGIEVLDILEKMGVDLNKVVICHVDGKINLDYYKKVMERGALIEFDDFGRDYKQIYKGDIYCFTSDNEKVEAIYNLININDDWIKKILIATDVFAKIDYVKYGGYGYAHILKNIIPWFFKKKFNFTDGQINYLISENAKGILSIKKR